MAIYEKPVRLLFKDFVTDQNIVKGQTISRDQVVSWFKSKYPKIKMGTISAHFLKMSVNAPSRIHYSVNANGDDDLSIKLMEDISDCMKKKKIPLLFMKNYLLKVKRLSKPRLLMKTLKNLLKRRNLHLKAT